MCRDLKPENILFHEKSPESRIRIIDFGRSRLLKFNEKVTELAGSIYYVAPEVLYEKEYNEMCDMWSCGVLLHMLLTGNLPFEGFTQADIATQIKFGRVEYTSKHCSQV